MIDRVYSVAGMHCPSCVELISDEVGAVDGVESVLVDLDGGRANVKFDPELVNDAMVIGAIREAGYDAEVSG